MLRLKKYQSEQENTLREQRQYLCMRRRQLCAVFTCALNEPILPHRLYCCSCDQRTTRDFRQLFAAIKVAGLHWPQCRSTIDSSLLMRAKQSPGTVIGEETTEEEMSPTERHWPL